MYKITLAAIFENKNESKEMLTAIFNHFGANHHSIEDGKLTFKTGSSTRFYKKFDANHYANLINQIASSHFGFACDPAIVWKRENSNWVIS